MRPQGWGMSARGRWSSQVGPSTQERVDQSSVPGCDGGARGSLLGGAVVAEDAPQPRQGQRVPGLPGLGIKVRPECRQPVVQRDLYGQLVRQGTGVGAAQAA